ncbi:FG-GAP repeat protein [Planctomycetes bacterium Poly30]|uniref:FG-GAP repeat protein n=1 Tax=Saltatorellus ferox TaxID=2528018 RepID=A0A518EPN8_9BACT|nr:FG-GAP repeat protein [Planctomycetes bacterium Poly30]
MTLPRTRHGAPFAGTSFAGALAFSAIWFGLGGTASAQQFTELSGALPGPQRWSEGVTAADVDLDGDLDLFFANGDGFSTAGTKRQNTLIINKLVEQGPNVYVDESVARLGVHASNAKMPVVGDVNGDGYPDVLFVNAFNTDPPFLYINRGAAQPGFFDLESAARGLTEVLSSAGGQFGDVDEDGDLDLVITDSGASFLGGAGATPKLYLNDGNGFFTDVSAQLNAPAKVAQMDVNLVDIDRDWDLDIFLTNRAQNSNGTHYLLINDGTGNFTNRSNLIPQTSGSVYEAEAGDLDGDDDDDLFFVSLSGFQEGHVRNDLVETGSLGFTAGSVQPGNVDDNEVALFDYDIDGDLDVLIGSLGNRERVYRNDGGLSFANATGVVQNIADSTLDLAVADLDNDGDHDIITAQGESGNFTNRVYLNSGPADTLAPIVVDQSVGEATATRPRRLRGRMRDQVSDDGEIWVTAEAIFARVQPTVVEVRVTGAGFAPAALTVVPGTRVRFVDGGVGSATIAEGGALGWTLALPAGGAVERVMVADLSQSVSASGVTGLLQLSVSGPSVAVKALQYGNAVFSAPFPSLSSGPTAEIAHVWKATDRAGNVGWSESGVARDEGAPGLSYCDPALNSTGEQARTILRGSDLLADQSLTLEAWALPPSSFGFFLASRTQGAMPVSQGTFCLGQPFGRFSSFVQNSGAGGAVALPLPFQQLPGAVNFLAGESWNFTYWFRDANPLIGANFSDGVELVWR